MNKDDVIETVGLTKRTGTHTRVQDLHLVIPRGCVYGFLGPNGAGKTTTMKMLLGLIHPTAGEIYMDGMRVTTANQFRINQQIGSLIENPGCYLHLTGQENLEIVARYKDCGADEVADVLQLVHLYGDKDRPVRQYSLGMKQRLGIAAALLGTPEILILDEPTNGLDPAGIQEMRALIRSLPSRYDMTVLISSHLLNEVEQMADEVGILQHGQMLWQGPLRDLERDGNDLEDVFLALTGEEASR